LFIGVFIEKIALGTIGWILMLCWVLWVICMPATIETFQLTFERRRGTLNLSIVKYRFIYGFKKNIVIKKS